MGDIQQLVLIVFLGLPIFTLIVTLFVRMILRHKEFLTGTNVFTVDVSTAGYGYYRVGFKKVKNRDFIYDSDLFKGVNKNKADFDELHDHSIIYDFGVSDGAPDVLFVQNVILDYIRFYKKN